MKKIKLLKEVSSGALTLAILAIIMMLYFSKFNGDFNFMKQNSFLGNLINITPTGYLAPSQNISINNLSCEVKWPSNKVIILRMDDVQSFAWAGISMNITNTVLERNMSIVLGVIPGRLDEKNNGGNLIASYLLNKSYDNRLEIAVHGFNHVENEFNVSEEKSYDMLKSSIQKIENVTHKIPVTFIPPNNVYSNGSVAALSKLGIYVISSNQDEYKFDGNIFYIGFSTTTKHSDLSDLNPIDDVIKDCDASLDLKNICVIMMHPQDYVNQDGVTMNETRYIQFVKLLDGLDKLNATFTTFKDLLKCQNTTSNIISQLIE